MKTNFEKKKIARSNSHEVKTINPIVQSANDVIKIMHPKLSDNLTIDLNTNPRKLFAFRVNF